MAVLSILLTAPLGAIGIKILGARVLTEGERSPYRFKELREKLALPRVGERVVSRRHGSVWKVIEEKEVWMEDATVSSGSARLTPAIYLRYWRDASKTDPGTGKTRSYRYSQIDPSFDEHWEILYDW